MSPRLAWLGLVPLACTMPNPAFGPRDEQVADDEQDGALDESESSDESSDASSDTLDGSTSASTTAESDVSTADPDTSDSSTTEDPGEWCGNGIVDAQEACDDANDEIDDECNPDCTLPTCGDGYVQLDEECDDANLDPTDACTNTCDVAFCGDGIVRVGFEECESEGDDGCIDCTIAFRRVFVTSEVYGGGALGGLGNADATCNEHASSAGLGGQFKAWLSKDGESALDRMQHLEVPYVLPDQLGTPIALGFNDLVDGNGLLAPIIANEYGDVDVVGTPCGDGSRVWTGTKPDGTTHAAHCGGFANPNSTGMIGAANSFTSWTLCNQSISCSSAARLYCFQQ